MVTRGSPKPLLRVRILLPLPRENLHRKMEVFSLYNQCILQVESLGFGLVGLDLGAILTGGNTGEFFEGTKEIGIVAEAAEIRNLGKGFLFKELFPGEHDTAVNDVVIDAVMDIMHKLMGKSRDADAETLGKLLEG